MCLCVFVPQTKRTRLQTILYKYMYIIRNQCFVRQSEKPELKKKKKSVFLVMVLCIPQYGISPVISKPTASGVMKDRAGMVEINLE